MARASVKRLRRVIRRGSRGRKSIAFLVDGESVSLDDIANVFRQYSKIIGGEALKPGEFAIVYSKAIFQENISDELITLIESNGCLPMIYASNIDIHLTLLAMEQIYNKKIDALILLTMNPVLLPVILRAKELHKQVILIEASKVLPTAIANAADTIIHLDGKKVK